MKAAIAVLELYADTIRSTASSTAGVSGSDNMPQE